MTTRYPDPNDYHKSFLGRVVWNKKTREKGFVVGGGEWRLVVTVKGARRFWERNDCTFHKIKTA